jgi:hypothetical protein
MSSQRVERRFRPRTSDRGLARYPTGPPVVFGVKARAPLAWTTTKMLPHEQKLTVSKTQLPKGAKRPHDQRCGPDRRHRGKTINKLTQSALVKL